jgi:hypothetical protein
MHYLSSVYSVGLVEVGLPTQPGQLTVNYNVQNVSSVAYIHCYLLMMGN